MEYDRHTDWVYANGIGAQVSNHSVYHVLRYVRPNKVSILSMIIKYIHKCSQNVLLYFYVKLIRLTCRHERT